MYIYNIYPKQKKKHKIIYISKNTYARILIRCLVLLYRMTVALHVCTETSKRPHQINWVLCSSIYIFSNNLRYLRVLCATDRYCAWTWTYQIIAMHGAQCCCCCCCSVIQCADREEYIRWCTKNATEFSSWIILFIIKFAIGIIIV